MQKGYIQCPGIAVKKDNRFAHIMALALHPSNYTQGIIRCITSREGDVAIKGFADRSALYLVCGGSLTSFEIGEQLHIHNEVEILDTLRGQDGDCIGLEDPDIYLDSETGLVHVYFTIPIKYPGTTKKTQIHLGHAVGRDLQSLTMTQPVLLDNGKNSAKELSIAPLNKNGFRYNLVESRDHEEDIYYSTIQVALVSDMGALWEYGEIIFHPLTHNISWIGGHASPGPLFSRDFIDVGEGKLLGLINGRESNQKIDDTIFYGMFSVGLCIYDYEHGKMDWVSPEPFIRDSEARTITFASQIVETQKGEAIIYAHVDDSYVRAYMLQAEAIKKMLPL